MKSTTWKTVAKWLWVSAVLAFVTCYAWPRRERLLEDVATLGIAPACFALIFIVIAKLGLVENMRLACFKFGIHLGWWDCFCIYNHTQLAKYVPGSIWQFVGRIGILINRGCEGRTIRDALVVEHFWVILVATILGFGMLLISDSSYLPLLDWIGALFEQWGKVIDFALVLAAIASIIMLLIIWKFSSHASKLLQWSACLIPTWRIVLVLFITWMMFGASLWITTRPFLEHFPPFDYLVSVYCLAYLIGFLVPFAPAGIGVREVVLVLGLSTLVNSEVALLLSGANRLIYFFAELILATVGVVGNWRRAI